VFVSSVTLPANDPVIFVAKLVIVLAEEFAEAGFYSYDISTWRDEAK